MKHAVETHAGQIPEHLPDNYRNYRALPRLGDALRLVHLPGSIAEYEHGRNRLLFDDLIEFQLGIALRRRAWRRAGESPSIEVTAKIDSRIRRLFPFTFTAGQDQAIREIVSDLKQTIPMHRLLQADVGAGKTVVAVYAMLAAIANGYQAAMMVPTEVLASQHWETIDSLLAQSRVERALLTGRLTAKRRAEILDDLRTGRIQLVVGTQSLIQEAVEFQRLGVAVVDEQHKFGVHQRAKFSAGEHPPHVLVMTATPIPRSLCLTQFGDLDLTTVSELPPGRQRVVTSIITGSP
jgi:ATP-dependent DNA helicase RecG